VALEMRQQHPGLPIIFFTAYSDYKDEELEQQLNGNYSLLRKPLSHDVLRAEVQRLLPERACFG
jgi:DNA-binding NtrC family response regulator